MTDIANIVRKMQDFFGAGVTGQVLTSRGPGRTWDFQNLPPAAPAGGGILLQEILNIDGEAQDGTGATSVPLDDTIPTNTEGFEVMTVIITPTNALNILIIDALAHVANSTNPHTSLALYQDAIAAAIAVGGFRTDAASFAQPFAIHRMVAGTVSPITFRARIGTNASGDLAFNARTGALRTYGGALSSYIRVRELTP